VASLGVAVPGASVAGADHRDKAVAGERSLGDPLLPQLGNGGYDVRHYRIELDYDPELNHLDAAQTTILAVAKKRLREFSFDFQDALEVVGVTVNGHPAEFESVARPRT
jgi:hypothetical protein